MEVMIEHWRSQMSQAEAQLKTEQIGAVREITRGRIANYRAWIAQAEEINASTS